MSAPIPRPEIAMLHGVRRGVRELNPSRALKGRIDIASYCAARSSPSERHVQAGLFSVSANKEFFQSSQSLNQNATPVSFGTGNFSTTRDFFSSSVP